LSAVVDWGLASKFIKQKTGVEVMSEATPFDVLSNLLRPYAEEMTLKHDTDKNYYLEENISSSKLQMFGAAQVKKSYTSFHLFPVYCNSDLLNEVSDKLQKRMQGKACFNFKSVDQIPLKELKELVQSAYASLLKE